MNWSIVIDALLEGPASWLWPIAVLPTLAAAIGNRAARLLPPTRADWRIAAVLAGGPGLVMLVLLTMAVGRGILHFHLDDVPHLIKYQLVWLIAPAIVVPAVVKTRRRGRELRLLTSTSVSPQPRLTAAAEAVGIKVRELPLALCECFVAGAWRPIAYISTGAVERMSDEELSAALHHERAHARNHDPALYMILGFLVDLVRTRDDAMLAYRQARERQADAEAVTHAGPLPLASALIAVARPHPTMAFGMAGADAAWRLRAILAVEPETSAADTPPQLFAALVVNGMALLWPAVQVPLAFLLCST